MRYEPLDAEASMQATVTVVQPKQIPAGVNVNLLSLASVIFRGESRYCPVRIYREDSAEEVLALTIHRVFLCL
jgi:hypothetical protein